MAARQGPIAPGFLNCISTAALNNTKYLQWCVCALCPYPCWCLIQNKILDYIQARKKLDQLLSPIPDFPCCRCLSDLAHKPLCCSLCCCCLGLAVNRGMMRLNYGNEMGLDLEENCLRDFCSLLFLRILHNHS